MNQWLDGLLGQLHSMSGWEAVAVVLAIAYLWLAMRQSQWCWPAAFVSTLIYAVIFWEVALLSESLLSVYYMAMAIYGYWQWRQGPRGDNGLPIHSWRWPRHLWLVSLTGLASLLLGWLMANHTHADLPYLDAATTCFAVVTTVLVARKVLENWIYWFIIDAVSIYLYVAKGLWLTAALFLLYLAMVVVGYWRWRQAHQLARSHEQAPFAVA